MIIIFDVDETLLSIDLYNGFPERLLPKWDGKWFVLNGIHYKIAVRPGIPEFLEALSKKNKLIAFSIAGIEVTRMKLKFLDILKYFDKVYGRENLIEGKKSCKFVASQFNLPLKDVIAIDDLPFYWKDGKIIQIEGWEIGMVEKGLDEIKMELEKWLK